MRDSDLIEVLVMLAIYVVCVLIGFGLLAAQVWLVVQLVKWAW